MNKRPTRKKTQTQADRPTGLLAAALGLAPKKDDAPPASGSTAATSSLADATDQWAAWGPGVEWEKLEKAAGKGEKMDLARFGDPAATVFSASGSRPDDWAQEDIDAKESGAEVLRDATEVPLSGIPASWLAAREGQPPSPVGMTGEGWSVG